MDSFCRQVVAAAAANINDDAAVATALAARLRTAACFALSIAAVGGVARAIRV